MKNIYKGFIVIMLVATMLMTAACGKADSTNKDSKKSDMTNTDNKDQTHGPELPHMDTMHKYEPAITMTTAKSVSDDKSYPEGEDPQNNVVYKMLEDVIGIKFENKFSAPFDAYIEKVKLNIASNEIPDMLMVTPTELNLLIKGDMIYDLKPYYDRYASDNLKKNLEFRDKICFAPVTRGEKVYGMPSVSDAYNGIVELYLRSDWMKKLNLHPPETMDDLFAIAKAFTEQDPDGNNKNDTFGFALSKDMYPQMYGFMNAYGAYPRLYLKNQDGSYRYGSLDTKVKTVLAKLSEGYKQGLFDREFAAKDMGKVAESIAAGKVGIIFGEFFYHLWPLWDSHRNNPEADWDCYSVPVGDVDKFVPTAPINASVFYVVRKGYKNPEALIIAMNHFAEQSYGNYDNALAKEWMRIGADPKYASLGVHNWLPFVFDRPDANVVRYRLYQEALDTGSEDKMDPGQLQLWKNNVKPGYDGDESMWAWPRVYFKAVKVIAAYEKFQTTEYFGPPTDAGQKYEPALLKLENEAFISIITGNKQVDEFDNFVKQWNDMGGKKIIEEMNEFK